MIDEQISPELVLVDPELAARVRPFAVAGPTISPPPPPPPARPVPPPVSAPAPAPPRVPVPAPILRPPADASAAPPAPRAPARPAPARPYRHRGRSVLVRALPTLAGLAILGLAFLSPRNAPSLTEQRSAPPTTTSAAVPKLVPRVRTKPPTPSRVRTVPPQATTKPRKRPPAKPTPTPAKRPPPQAPKTRPPTYAGPTTLTWRPRPGADYYLVELLVHGRLVHAASVTGRSFAVPTWLPKGRYDWRVLAGKGSPSERRTAGVVEHGWFIRSQSNG